MKVRIFILIQSNISLMCKCALCYLNLNEHNQPQMAGTYGLISSCLKKIIIIFHIVRGFILFSVLSSLLKFGNSYKARFASDLSLPIRTRDGDIFFSCFFKVVIRIKLNNLKITLSSIWIIPGLINY